jgi:hypothetical protein
LPARCPIRNSPKISAAPLTPTRSARCRHPNSLPGAGQCYERRLSGDIEPKPADRDQRHLSSASATRRIWPSGAACCVAQLRHSPLALMSAPARLMLSC